MECAASACLSALYLWIRPLHPTPPEAYCQLCAHRCLLTRRDTPIAYRASTPVLLWSTAAVLSGAVPHPETTANGPPGCPRNPFCVHTRWVGARRYRFGIPEGRVPCDPTDYRASDGEPDGALQTGCETVTCFPSWARNRDYRVRQRRMQPLCQPRRSPAAGLFSLFV